MSVTIYDISKKCKCSTTTVSKVFNNQSKISLQKKQEILKAAKELGYVPSQTARSLASADKASRLIGVILHISEDRSITHEMFSKILNSFRIEMEKHDYDICFLRNIDNDDEIDYYTLIQARGIDGVFIISTDVTNKKVRDIPRRDVPYVAFDILNAKYLVTSNNQEIVAKMVDYLVSEGHKRISYVYPHNYGISQERYLGFLKGLERNNIPFDERMIIHAPYYCHNSAQLTVDAVMKSGYKPTVIMFQDDYTAVESITYLRDIGYKVPNDISITGFDGIELSKSIRPPLTTVRQNVEQIGLEAAKLLLQQINKETIEASQIVVDASLLINHSVLNINEKGEQDEN